MSEPKEGYRNESASSFRAQPAYNKQPRGEASMSLPKVSLLLKRPAEAPAPAPDRRVKPRAAPPPSEDLEAAKALSGLFAAAPAATSAQASSPTL